MDDLGKTLIVFGGAIVVAGGLILLAGRIPGLGLGRLPGDIVIQRDGFSCFFPLVTSILLSLVLTVVLSLLARLLNR